MRTNPWKLVNQYEAIASDIKSSIRNHDDISLREGLDDAAMIEETLRPYVKDLSCEDRDQYDRARKYINRVRSNYNF